MAITTTFRADFFSDHPLPIKVYFKAELRAKLAEVEKKLPWLETLDVSVANDTMDPKAVDDDFEREIVL